MAGENKRLKAEYQRLFDQLAEILYRYDPIGIGCEESNEYEPEARTILPRLKLCNDSNDVVTVVHEEFQKWFGPDVAGDQESYRSLGEEIWRLWNQREISQG